MLLLWWMRVNVPIQKQDQPDPEIVGPTRQLCCLRVSNIYKAEKQQLKRRGTCTYCRRLANALASTRHRIASSVSTEVWIMDRREAHSKSMVRHKTLVAIMTSSRSRSTAVCCEATVTRLFPKGGVRTANSANSPTWRRLEIAAFLWMGTGKGPCMTWKQQTWLRDWLDFYSNLILPWR